MLTPRETEVMVALADGLTWDQAARRLHMARATVNHHRRSVSEKLGGGSTIDLLRAMGWLRVPDHLRASGSDADGRQPVAGRSSPTGVAVTPAPSTEAA